jgi:hypothetical protein
MRDAAWRATVLAAVMPAGCPTPWSAAVAPASGEDDPTEAAGRLGRLFEDARDLADDRDGWAVAIWHLVDPSSSAHGIALADGRVPLPVRRRALLAIGTLYGEFFDAPPATMLQDGDDRRPMGLATLRFMFWDILPVRPRGDDGRPAAEDDICLRIMEETLRSANVAVVESGLHGLGHWWSAYPRRIRSTVDALADRRRDLPAALLAYASAVGRGAVG